MNGSCHRRVLCGFLASGCTLAASFLAAAAPAQAPSSERIDYLEQVRRMTEIAAQKVENDVRAALREAQKLAQTDPAKAIENLKQMLANLDDETLVPQERRERLARLLKERIRILETPAKGPAVKPEVQPVRPRQRENESNRAAEFAKIRAELDAIRALQKDGQIEEARRQAEGLARRYPDNPALAAAGQTATAATQLANNRSQRSDAERRIAAVTRDVSRSAAPPVGELEYPEDWIKRTKNRSGMDTSFTAQEKAIVRALNAPISVDFKGSRIDEVVEYLASATKQPIMLDRAALNEAQVSYDTPVTVKLDGVALRTVLRRVLSDLGLAYVIKDQTLQITSAVRAKEMMIVRTYYLGDLLGSGGIGNSFGFPLVNPNNTALVAQQASQIMESIESTVEPASWQKNGGSGTITFSAPLMALIIRQSAEVHAILAGGM
jgi:hypothetical protein